MLHVAVRTSDTLVVGPEQHSPSQVPLQYTSKLVWINSQTISPPAASKAVPEPINGKEPLVQSTDPATLGRESLNDVHVTPSNSVIPDSTNEHIGSPDTTVTIPDTCKVPIDSPEVPQITNDNKELHNSSPETVIIDPNSFLNPLPFPDIPVTVEG